MGDAKAILVKPIARVDAVRIVKAIHYSHKIVNNSQIHLGVFIGNHCGGAMQFGPSLGKRKLIGLVKGTAWNEFIELNRMAFADWLPRNSESRAIGYAMRWLRKTYPFLKWVVSFADATQCGDGTIYRASGFLLSGISRGSMWLLPPELVGINNGPVAHRMTIQDKENKLSRYILTKTRGKNLTMEKYAQTFGGSILPGAMLRYLFFLHPEERANLTVPVLAFSKIKELGLSMYRGKSMISAGSKGDVAPAIHAGEGGSTPTPALHRPNGRYDNGQTTPTDRSPRTPARADAGGPTRRATPP